MNKKWMIMAVGTVAVVATVLVLTGRGKQDSKEQEKLVAVRYGSIQSSVSSTGNIQPQNRLEIKPPIGGRIESILVEEGQKVTIGQAMAIMSSTERATLLDAARLQGAKDLKEWEDVYKPTPLLAPLEGQVIVKAAKPGQTVTTADVIIVISDRLIVQAQVDETDIGRVKVGQKAVITLDAYPEIEVKAKVDHIYYESKVVNNVTMYGVDLVPEEIPEVFRSGMSANVQIIQERKDSVLIVPREVVRKKDGVNAVMIKVDGERKPQRREITVGISDDNHVQVLSGLQENDQIVQWVADSNAGRSQRQMNSPFMPSRPGGGRGR